MVKDHLKEALELFESGFNCSQSILVPFSNECGIPKEAAMKIAYPFGGGMGGYGRTCGALTAAMMVVGMKYETTSPTDLGAKSLSREKTRMLIDTFEKAHGTSLCNDLVGIDRTNLSGAALMAVRPDYHNICPKFLETVITFLEEEL